MTNFSRLIEISKALKKTAQTGKHFHCSFLLRGRKIVCIGTNRYDKSNVVAMSYKPRYSGDYIAGIHSENAVLSRFKYRDKMSDITLVNIRINNLGHLANSCPCCNCALQIESAQLKGVWYSVADGFRRFS